MVKNSRSKPTRQVTQHIVDCLTVEDFYSSEHTRIRVGSWVFVFYDEKEHSYRAIRTWNEDDIIPFLEEQNKAPIGYGIVVNDNRVALTLFDGQELKDDG